MAKQYKWQIDLSASGPLAAGILSGDTSEHITDAPTGSITAQYYFIDSNYTPSGAWQSNQSRVVIDVTTSWTATFDSRNNLSLAVTTTINSIVRDNVIGNPTAPNTSGRNMSASRFEGGVVLWSYHDTDIAAAKTIATNVTALGTFTFNLAPSSGNSQHSMYFFNKNDTYETQGDRLNMGVKFENITPPDYRPGAINDGSSKWLSHNRENGECHILGTNGKFIEMRTINGLAEAGNPPSVRVNDKWMNQRLIGKE